MIHNTSSSLHVSPTGIDGGDTAAIGAAVSVAAGLGGTVSLGPGEYSIDRSIVLAQGVSVRGSGEGSTLIAFTGAGGAAFTQRAGKRIYRASVSDMTIDGSRATGETTGLDILDISLGYFSCLTIQGFETAVRLSAPDIEGRAAYYNTLIHVTASSCATGFDVGYRANENRMIACRANSTSTGYRVVDGNHNHFAHCEASASTTGFDISQSTAARGTGNVIAFARIEDVANGVVVADVSETVVFMPYVETTTTPYIDTGARTVIFDPSAKGRAGIRMAMNIGDREQFHLERIASATTNPMMHLKDANTGSGTPTTLQLTTERPLGSFVRGVRGGVTYWNVNAQGHTSQSGHIEMVEQASDATAPATNGVRLYAKDVGGKTALFARFATGVAQQIAVEP